MMRSRPPRVLHVVESLDRGAVENWLVRMLRHARHRHVLVDWTFYSAIGRPGALDGEVRLLGGDVIHAAASRSNKAAFIHHLRGAAQAGGYDVIHCHHDLVSALYLAAVTGLPIRRRVVHVHNADEEVLTPSRFKQVLYREPMRRICLGLADRIVGISNHTLDTFLAGRPRRAGRDIVHYYGVDPQPFTRLNVDRRRFRRELGLPPEARVLLFAGRLVPEKNPLLAVDILARMRRKDSTVVGVFVGSGSLEDEIQPRADQLGVGDAVRRLGWRDDVAAVMAASDWFILPRPEQPAEGFGLAVVEAQLAGLRLLLSCGIPDDPLLPTAEARRIPLAAGPDEWAKAALEMLDRPAPKRAAALTALARSPMDMDTALDGLMALHG